jgi:hypothetical protein
MAIYHRILTLTALWLNMSFSIFGQTPERIIDEAIAESAADQNRDEVITKDAAKKLEQFEPTLTSSVLYSAFQRPDRSDGHTVTVIQIIRKLPKFDFGDWVAHLDKEPDPMLLSYGMTACTTGRETLPPVLKIFLQRKLSDRRVGEKLYGEARAYASEGLRVCDRALHELWSFEPEDARPSRYTTFSAATSVKERDQMIADYVKKFGVTSVNLSEGPSKARRIGPPVSPLKDSGGLVNAPPIDSTAPALDEIPPARSGSYLGISLSLAILAGLAGWLLVRSRRRKN